jgi:hypothetical protein
MRNILVKIILSIATVLGYVGIGIFEVCNYCILLGYRVKGK